MTRVAFGVSVLVVALSGGGVMAQPPVWVGGLPPVGDLYGYSPLVPAIDPFPTRTSGYAHSIFLPRVGGKRIYPAPRVTAEPLPVVVAPQTPTVASPVVAGVLVAGPVVTPIPVRGWHRFRQ